MKPVVTAKILEEAIRAGDDLDALTRNAVITPGARDLLRDHQAGKPVGGSVGSAGGGQPGPVQEPVIPDYEYKWTSGTDPKTAQEIAKFYDSPTIRTLRERMAEMGRRIWQREYVDGNGGNLTVRVGDNMVLCTPTLISKGAMTADDMCLVDFEGKQLAGRRKRTSEVMTHLGIMRRQPKAKACCHAHPVHATAFAVAHVQPPTCMIPEAEVFLGQIGLAPYETPGSPANAEAVGEVGKDHQAVLMLNHGVITWGKDIEDAYWKMENVDAYCKTVWIASQLGKPLQTISGSQAKELIQLRESLGMDDPRSELKECELCNNQEFRPGVTCAIPASAGSGSVDTPSSDVDPEAEALVQQLTDQIVEQIGSTK
ncbi:MAG: class II aldolase/adducin family protein [Opitutales bacterium]